jgi:type IV fimbrial biogenesis protein FimT
MIELMVVLAVGAILLVIAAPSFRNLTLSNQLTTTANDIVGAIYTARMEAVKLNAGTQLCSNSTANNSTGPLGTACNTSTQTGAIYALTGATTTAQIRAATAGISTPLQLSGDMIALRFTTAGLGQAAGATAPFTGYVVDICTSSMSTNNHRKIYMAAGSIITTSTSSGACP